MNKECLITLIQSPELHYKEGFLLNYDGALSFTPAPPRFEFEFNVKVGEGQLLIEKFQKDIEDKLPTEIQLFTPAGLIEKVKLVGLQTVKSDSKKTVPADVMRAEIDLTPEQIIAFTGLDSSSNFGY